MWTQHLSSWTMEHHPCLNDLVCVCVCVCRSQIISYDA
jgi:hypothetical protein